MSTVAELLAKKEQSLLSIEPTATVMEAANLMNEKRYLEGLEVYRENLGRQQPDSRTHAYYATELIRFLRPTEAIGVIDEALTRKLEPASGLRFQRGLAHILRGDSEAAEKDHDRRQRGEREEEGDRGGVEKGQVDPVRLFLVRIENLLDAGQATKATTLLAEGSRFRVPEGAAPLTECENRDTYLCRSFAKTESITAFSSRACTRPTRLTSSRCGT